MKDFITHSTHSLKSDLKTLREFIMPYVRNPVRSMDKVPQFHWPSLLIFQGTIQFILSALQGVLTLNLFMILNGLIIAPIVGALTLIGSSGIFYYIFLLFYKTELDFKKLTHVVFFASLPSAVLSLFIPWIPGVILLGLGFSSLLLIVGLVDNFFLKARSVTKLILSIYLVFCALSVLNYFR